MIYRKIVKTPVGSNGEGTIVQNVIIIINYIRNKCGKSIAQILLEFSCYSDA